MVGGIGDLMTRVHIDQFSVGLDELKPKSQRNPVRVLRMLYASGRFSVFEATASPAIAKTMDWLYDNGYFKTDNSCGYPWTKVVKTPKGESLIAK